MIRFIRQWVLEVLLLLRSSPLRRLILRTLVWFHNTSYHLIALYASAGGTHPKHDIQKYHEFFLANVSPTDRVLDVGCGRGEVAYDVAAKAAHVVAVDIEERSITRAEQHYHRPNLQFLVTDATTHQFGTDFNVIILSNVLEHIKERVGFLKKLSRLAPTILIRVPMITRDWISVYKKNEGFEYRLDDTHYIEYDEPTFREEIAAAGLIITHLHVNFGELYAVVKRTVPEHI